MTPTPRNTDETDENLAVTVARRDVEDRASAVRAFERLYERHARDLLAFIAARVSRRNDLDDLHQEVWHRVWARLPSGFDGKHFRGWLFRVARNLIIDEGRIMRPESFEVVPPVPDREAGPLDQMVASERTMALEACLKELDATSRQVVAARLAGDDYEEIAVAIALPVARLYKVWNKAVAKLNACMKRAGL